MYESLKFAAISFVLPPAGPLIVMAIGLLVWRSRPRLARILSTAGVALLWLVSLPIVSGALVTLVGGTQAVDLAAARKADAIVILGGGVRPRALEYGGDTLGRLSLERTRYGALLAQRTGLPVLVTGGSPKRGVRAEADLMREALAGEYGVAVRWVDARSRNTHENAANAARLLHADGKRVVVLVMHGFDVRRATRTFQAAGLEVIPAPTMVPQWLELGIEDFLPDISALYVSYYALYEVLALSREAVVSVFR